MGLELWLAFAAASAVLLAIPGPTVILVVSYSLNRGRSSGWATVPGVMLGDFTAMTVSLLGAGAALAASADLFVAVKLAGAAYLIYLGIKIWRSKPAPVEASAGQNPIAQGPTPKARLAMFWHAYVVTALNPKGIVFFVAFVPQFVDPAQPALAQFALLEATFLVLAGLNVALWAMLAGEMRKRLSRLETVQRLNRVGASFLIGAGVLTAAIRHQA
jgi:threonine/homoserine/homoserine lactone efflux protein